MVLTATAGAVLAIVLGAMICLFGYRLLRVTLAVIGFAVGATLGALVASNIAGVGQVFILIIAIACGLLGAVLAAVLYKAGVFLLGAGAGALIASFFVAGMTGATGIIVIIAAAIVAGVVTLFLQRPMVSVLTAFGGSWGVAMGVFHLVGWHNMNDGLAVVATLRKDPTRLLVVIGCWVVLGIIGAIVQLAGRKKRR